MRKKDETFRERLAILETEIKRHLQESTSKEDFSRLQREYDGKVNRLQSEVREREMQIDKVRQ